MCMILQNFLKMKLSKEEKQKAKLKAEKTVNTNVRSPSTTEALHPRKHSKHILLRADCNSQKVNALKVVLGSYFMTKPNLSLLNN